MPSRSAKEILENKVIKTSELINPKIQNTVNAYASDGAIAITNRLVKLTKGSAGAYTLAAPTVKEEGCEMTITSASAYAHVVTATGLIEDGITGGAKTTMTFAAFKGATITLIAISAKWHVKSKNVVTIT